MDFELKELGMQNGYITRSELEKVEMNLTKAIDNNTRIIESFISSSKESDSKMVSTLIALTETIKDSNRKVGKLVDIKTLWLVILAVIGGTGAIAYIKLLTGG